MKIFSWMQRKLNGTKPNPKLSPKNHRLMHETSKEEFSDWPNGLLAIGTFGNTALKDAEEDDTMTNEELRELQKELILHCDFTGECSSPKQSTPAEKFFDFLKTLEGGSAVISTGKDDDRLRNRKENMSKKSVTFLLKKAFHRIRKFKLAPQFGDPMQELKLERSRLDKILRATLKKKVYPQAQSRSSNKILDQKYPSETDSDDEEASSDQGTWVKTDSDYIVLEI